MQSSEIPLLPQDAKELEERAKRRKKRKENALAAINAEQQQQIQHHEEEDNESTATSSTIEIENMQQSMTPISLMDPETRKSESGNNQEKEKDGQKIVSEKLIEKKPGAKNNKEKKIETPRNKTDAVAVRASAPLISPRESRSTTNNVERNNPTTARTRSKSNTKAEVINNNEARAAKTDSKNQQAAIEDYIRRRNILYAWNKQLKEEFLSTNKITKSGEVVVAKGV